MIICADVIDGLRRLEDESIQCVVTSPPYWGLRDYGVDGQIGLEETPDAHVAALVDVFREVRRVLTPDGTLWLNYGDCYASSVNGTRHEATKDRTGNSNNWRHGLSDQTSRPDDRAFRDKPINTIATGLKPKDLVGMPWRVAFALQADSWWLRCDIIWHKPNPMPESVTDRPTRSHEYVFLLAKSERYFFDAEAIRETAVSDHDSGNGYARPEQITKGGRGQEDGWVRGGLRNRRSVWTIPTQPYAEAHFATFPERLAALCIQAGSRPGDTVLDPFAGSGTTLAVARRYGREGVGIELNPEYVALAERRLSREQHPLPLGTE